MRTFPVTGIQSVDIGVPDLQAAERFYTQAWGLELAERRAEAVYLRASGADAYVLGLHPREQACALWVTFTVGSRERLPQIGRAVSEHGGKVLQSNVQNDAPGCGTLLTIETPEGYVLRFLEGAQLRPDSCVRRGYPLRLSHVNLNCKNIDATTKFFEAALGLCLTDRSSVMAFLRCNADHHVVVLADSGIDGLNHVAFLMPDFDSLMRGVGRLTDYGYSIGWGVGRHGPGDNIFAYYVDPFGIVVEHTSDVLQVDESYSPKGPQDWKWPPGRTDQWGAAPPKTEATKKAQLAIRFVPFDPGTATKETA